MRLVFSVETGSTFKSSKSFHVYKEHKSVFGPDYLTGLKLDNGMWEVDFQNEDEAIATFDTAE